MSNLPETPTWSDDLLQLELTTPAKGGLLGEANAQAKVLGNRTRWLRERLNLVMSEVQDGRGLCQSLRARFEAIEAKLAYFLEGPLVAASVTPEPGYLVFAASVADNTGVLRVDFYIDGYRVKSFGVTDVAYTHTVMGTALANGSHAFVVRAQDNHGNWTTSAAVPFSVTNPSQGGTPSNPAVPTPDTEPPMITLVQVEGRSGTVYLVARCKDNVGLSRVEFSVDAISAGTGYWGSPVDATSGLREFRQPMDSRLIANGAHTLTVTAYDYAGNHVAFPDVSFQIENPADTEKPVVTSLQALASGMSVGLVAVASDNVRVKKVEFHVDGTLRATANTEPWSASVSGLLQGAHDATATAIDYAGNRATSAPVTFTI